MVLFWSLSDRVTYAEMAASSGVMVGFVCICVLRILSLQLFLQVSHLAINSTLIVFTGCS